MARPPSIELQLAGRRRRARYRADVAEPRSGAARGALVSGLERAGALTSLRVRDAFLQVPRELFLPGLPLRTVYRDEAIVTHQDARGVATSSSSQPAIMALMLDALSVEAGSRVLEIGAGTGYNAALLATLAGPRGRVVSVELDPETAAEACSALAAGGYAAEVVVADGRAGWPAGAPYDRIIVTASADEAPKAWHDQLVDGGLLVVPLRVGGAGVQAIPALRRDDAGFRSVAVLSGGFMPLRTRPDEKIERETLVEPPAGRPRWRPLGTKAPRWSLALYLAFELPPGRLAQGPAGIGVTGADGRSLALVTGGRVLDRVAAWGDPEPEELLVELLEEWHRRGEPTEAQLELSIRYEGRAAILEHRWLV